MYSKDDYSYDNDDYYYYYDDDSDDDYFLDDDYMEDEKPSKKGLFKKNAESYEDDYDEPEQPKPRFLPRASNNNKVVPMRRSMEVSLVNEGPFTIILDEKTFNK